MSEIKDRAGSCEPQVIVFHKGGRDFRADRMLRGEEVPREFFYGFFDLEGAGIPATMMSSAGTTPGLPGAIANVIERTFAAATGFGARPLSTRLVAQGLPSARVVMSYTDGFSLSLGLGYPNVPERPVLIGGFHGLSDVEDRVAGPVRPLVHRLIAQSLRRLDHVFFFGPADRQYAIEHYGLQSERSSVIPFGVDTKFWRPLPHRQAEDFVVAIGQDHNRDYDLLAAAPGRHPTRIVTRRAVKIPPGADHVQQLAGDYFRSDSLSDEDIRDLYNKACAVIVPLKDVYQPSGYSVTLQAMSCGRPVILTRIRGLWGSGLMRDGENCLLVPPGDADALGEAIARIRSDSAFAGRLGRAARETAVTHFGLDKIADGTLALARLGLALYDQRGSKAA